MAAGHEQREKRKRGRVVLEHAREQVSLEVMDRDRRALEPVRERRCERAADHERPDQARPRGVRDRVEVREL